jgi:hypothetical protein
MSVILPANRHPALIAFRWALTLFLAAATVAVLWAAAAQFQSVQARPQIGLGCTGRGVEMTVEAVRQAVDAWKLTHPQLPGSLDVMVAEGWLPESLLVPPGCSSRVGYVVNGESWSVRAPLH